MEAKDFKPIVYYTPDYCCPWWRFWDNDETDDTAETVRQRMNKWIEEQKDKIVIVNIETMDFESIEWDMKKAHFRVWYYIKT